MDRDRGQVESAASARVRVLHAYKRMILLGKVDLPWEMARRIVGPDCAFHLYGRGRAKRPRRRRLTTGC